MEGTNPGAGRETGKPKCGAAKRQGDGSPCKKPAGWGTDHPGSGKCRLHGGKTKTHRVAGVEAKAAAAVRTYGLPRDVSPTEALLEEVRYTAGHVAWLRERVQELEQQDVIWGVTERVTKGAGEYPGVDETEAATAHAWVELYYRERAHLVSVTKAAITAGIEERRVRLAESQGALIADVIKRILGRLNLSPKQQGMVPDVVPEELRRAAALN